MMRPRGCRSSHKWLLLVALIATGPLHGVEPVEYDAGVVLPGSQVRGSFAFPNRSPHAWSVGALQVGCLCTLATPLPATVAAGGTLEFTLVGRAGALAGAEVSTAWTTVREDGREVELVARLRCTVGDYLELPAGTVRVPPAGTDVRIIRGRFAERWSGLELESDPARFAASLVSDGDGWRVQAKPVVGGGHSGDFRSRVVFRFREGGSLLDHVQALVLAARLDGPVACRPGSLLVGAVVVGSERPASGVLAWREGSGPGAVATVTTSDPQRAAARLSPDGSRLELVFAGRAPLGQASGEILITMRDGHQIHVPYAAAVVAPGDIEP